MKKTSQSKKTLTLIHYTDKCNTHTYIVHVWLVIHDCTFICVFRYFLRVVVARRLSDIVKEMDIAVHTLSSYPDMNNR